MTSIFRRIDDFMFDRVFQPIVDRFPDQGPVGVARFTITGAALFFVASGSCDFVLHSWFDAAFTIWWLLVCTNCYLSAGRPSPRLGAGNPAIITRARDRGFASLLLTFIQLGIPVCFIGKPPAPLELFDFWCFYAAIFLRWAYEYAVACDVRPPKTRKASFWQSLLQSAPHGA